MGATFEWSVGDAPPVIEAHSAAKLELIALYLSRYFQTVSPDPRSDRLQISLIDGFCGGGAFLRGSERIPGSPIIMLESVKAAERALNRHRQKKIVLDAHFYFVDKSVSALSYLNKEIIDRGFGNQIGSTIKLINEPFNACYAKIVGEIEGRTRAGRSIFLLDQFGYNNIDFGHIRRILQALNRSEIILTFAVDWLIDYMSAHASFVKSIAPIEITERQLLHYLDQKGPAGWRFAVQRMLIAHLQASTGAPYFTPFFLRSMQSGRDLWLIHLSKHPTARNVMTSTHWDIGNASSHPGRAGLRILGFDPHWEDSLPLDFAFDENAATATEKALINDLPYAIERFTQNGAVTFDALQSLIANETSGRLDQIESALMQLHVLKDVEILTPTGQLKRSDAKVKSTDRVQLPRQLTIPGFKI